MPQINFITPQSFDIKIQEENTYKAFGTLSTQDGATGKWYTSTYDGYHSMGESDYGQYFPSPTDSFSMHWVLNKYIVNDGMGGESECALEIVGDIINDQIHGDCASQLETNVCGGTGICMTGDLATYPCETNADCVITDIFNYKSCCTTTTTLQTCDNDAFGDTNTVNFKKWDPSISDWEPEGCNFGMMLVVGAPYPDSNIVTMAINATAGDFPYGFNSVTSNPSTAALAGYDTTSGVYTGAGIYKYDRITLLDNGRYRRGNSYCDKNYSSHHGGVSFSCPGDAYDSDIGYINHVDTYGTYTISYDSALDRNFMTFVQDHTWSDGQYSSGNGVTSFGTNDSNTSGRNIISINDNQYGNPCVALIGTGTKHNGKSFTWDTIFGESEDPDYNCVNVGDAPSDVGFDFLIPQGMGEGDGDTPYNGLEPTHGLKVLKSYHNPAYGDYPGVLWFDREISIYYLASDGRYMTEGGSVGTYELNRKNETLKLNGLTQSSRCLPDGSFNNIDDCVNNGQNWYPEANTTIEIDYTGFQDGVLNGTISTKYAQFFDNSCGTPPCSQIAYTQIGEIKSLPAKFASSNIWGGTYGSGGNNTATFYLNSDGDNSHMSVIRHNTSGDSGADFGYSMVRTMVGSIGENPVDNWTNFMSGNTVPGDAWGWPTYKTFYGYGYDYLYASGHLQDIPFDPINGTEEDTWRYKEVAHRFLIGNDMFFDSDNPGDGFPYETLSDQGNVDLDHHIFSPNAPCDNVNVNCQSNLHGTIVNDELQNNSTFLLSGDTCDVSSNSSSVTCNGFGDPYPQCDNAGEIINICIGCMDPPALNYCVPFGCTYADFSCIYNVSPGEDEFVKCDANGDGGINILDIVVGVNFILTQDIDSYPFAYNLDYNEDGILDVLDIISCINEVMSNSNVSSSDESLMEDMLTTIKKPNGVKQVRKLASRNGYDIHKVRDYIRQGEKNKKAIHGTKRHQFWETKSNKVRINLTNSSKNFKNILGRK